MPNHDVSPPSGASSRIRRTIAVEAARLIRTRRETSISTAKVRAARTAFRNYVKHRDFPSDSEVLEELRQYESLAQGDGEEDEARWQAFEAMLLGLEAVALPRRTHPVGNALDHSLQVFSLVAENYAYDEELLTAALFHEVGWLRDPWSVNECTREMLETLVTERTLWFLEHLPEANRRFDGSLGTRAKRRLNSAADSDELWLFSDCDRAGRVSGAPVPSVDEALNLLRELASV